MARGDYAPEIKSAMAGQRESPADMRRDAARGIKEGSPQDEKLDAQPANQLPPNRRPTGGGAPASIQVQRLPNDHHHVAAAMSIAHAILGNSRMGTGGGGGGRVV
jgi:hypothetical protein